MIFSFQYTYLLMGFLFSFIWLLLFLIRKDIRKEMLIMSLIFGLAGPLTDVLYFKDWWHPLTFTNSWISFEAFIVGFMIGGISSVIYEEIFKDRLKQIRVNKKKRERDNKNFILILFLTAALLYMGFYLFNLNTLISTIIALIIPVSIIWFRRKDLIIVSFISGLLLLIVAVFVYSMLQFLTPGWVNEFWFFKNVPRVIILNVPVDDIIWYLLTGIYIGPLYPFWHEGKFVKI